MTAVVHTRIRYWAIREGIKSAIMGWPDLSGIPVLLEPSGEPNPEMLPAFFVFLTERQTIAENQRISAGKRTDHRLVFSTWALAYSLESMAVAVQQRDDMIGEMELALMADRQLGGLLPKSLTLEGGHVQSTSDQQTGLFVTVIETRIMCDVFAQVG